MPRLVSQKEMDRELDKGIREAEERHPKEFRVTFWKANVETRVISDVLYYAAEVNEYAEPTNTKYISDPDLVKLAKRVFRQYIMLGYEIEVCFKHPYRFPLLRKPNGTVCRYQELESHESFDVTNTLCDYFLEGKQTRKPKYLSQKQWNKYLQEVWEVKPQGHLTQELVVLFGDMTLSDGEEKARMDLPMTAAHLDSCDLCRSQFDMIIEMFKIAGS